MTPASLSWKCVVADACYQNQLAVKPVSVRFAKGKSVPRHARLRPAVTATGSAAQSSNGSDGQSIQQAQSVPGDPRQSASQAPSRGITQRLKKFFKGDKMDMQRLKALGLGAVASYGCVSNVTYGTGLAISWITFVQQTGKSPLMANQWKPFLALYGGFWAAQHLIRPLRFSLALAMAPVFDRFINWVQQQTKWKRQNAFACYLFLLGSVTCVTVFGSIRLFAGRVAFATI